MQKKVSTTPIAFKRKFKDARKFEKVVVHTGWDEEVGEFYTLEDLQKSMVSSQWLQEDHGSRTKSLDIIVDITSSEYGGNYKEFKLSNNDWTWTYGSYIYTGENREDSKLEALDEYVNGRMSLMSYITFEDEDYELKYEFDGYYYNLVSINDEAPYDKQLASHFTKPK